MFLRNYFTVYQVYIQNIETNIINPLQNHYQVDVYVFNNNVHGMKVDGIIQNNDDSHPYKIF